MRTVQTTIFGAFLLVAAAVMLFWAEGRAVHEAQALTEGAGLVKSVAADALDPANDGKLVHVSGPVVTQDTPSDQKLGVAAPKAVRLQRKAEMFQWQEVTRSEEKTDATGKSVKTDVIDYHKVWSEKAIDLATFKAANAPTNPPMAVSDQTFDVGEVKIGAFRLSGKDVAALGKTDSLLLREEDRAAVAAAMGSGRPVKLSANILTVATDPANPAVGDLRISYMSGMLDKVSVVAAQQGDSLVPFVASNGNSVFLVQDGLQPAATMFQSAQASNTALTWSLRFFGLVLMFVGAKFFLSLFANLSAALPLVGGLLAFGTTVVAGVAAVALSAVMIGLGWIFYRPLLGIGLIAVGVIIAFAMTVLGRNRAPAAQTARS